MPPIKINKDLPAIAWHTLLRSSTEGRLKVRLLVAMSSASHPMPSRDALAYLFLHGFLFLGVFLEITSSCLFCYGRPSIFGQFVDIFLSLVRLDTTF